MNLHALRDEYVHEDRARSGCGMGHFFVFFLIGALLFRLMRKRNQKRQQVMALLTALDSNPQLKAIVEAETGLPVPGPCCKCAGGVKPCCSRLCRALLMLVLVVATGFFVTISSLIISANIIMAMAVPDDSGNLMLPSPTTVILVLAAVMFAHVLLVITTTKLICKMIRGFSAHRQARLAATASTSSSNNNGGNGGASRCVLARLSNWLPTARPFAGSSAPTVPDSETRGLYAPLCTDNTEMITLSTMPMPTPNTTIQYGNTVVPSSAATYPHVQTHSPLYYPAQLTVTGISGSAPPMVHMPALSAEAVTHINML